MDESVAVDDSQELTLVYYNITGVAEKIRLLFAELNIPYKNAFLAWEDDSLPKLKATGTLPFGSVPIVRDGDNIYADSFAIMRFYGRKYGMTPESEELCYRNDLVIGAATDLFNELGLAGGAPEEQGRNELRHKFQTVTAPRKLHELDNLLIHAQTSYFTSDAKVAICDIIVFDTLRCLFGQIPALQLALKEHHPILSEFYNRFASRPRIQQYLKATDIPGFSDWSLDA